MKRKLDKNDKDNNNNNDNKDNKGASAEGDVCSKNRTSANCKG